MFKDIFQEKKVLISGNTGFKGSWLSVWLMKLGARVYGFSNDIPTTPSNFKVLQLGKKIKHSYVDVRDLDAVRDVFDTVKPDFVFHLAAQAIVSLSYLNPIRTIETNVLGTANVLEAMRSLEHKCIGVIITSDKCYDNVEWVWGYREKDTLGGKDVYSGSKGSAELVFKSYYHSFFKKKNVHIRVATARAGNVIGGGDWARDRIIPDCMRSWSENKSVTIRKPDATRPWQHVLEPLSGYLTLAVALWKSGDLNGESFNFGPRAGQNVTVKKLIEDLGNHWKLKDVVETFSLSESGQFHEARLLKLNCDKALTYLRWYPVLDYDQLIGFVGKWYYEYYEKKSDMLDYSLKQIEEYENAAKKIGLPWTQVK